MNRLTREPKGNTEKHGKELRGTREGLILWSLKALISALGILFLEVPYLAFC